MGCRVLVMELSCLLREFPQKHLYPLCKAAQHRGSQQPKVHTLSPERPNRPQATSLLHLGACWTQYAANKRCQTDSLALPSWTSFCSCVDIVSNKALGEDALPTLTPVLPQLITLNRWSPWECEPWTVLLKPRSIGRQFPKGNSPNHELQVPCLVLTSMAAAFPFAMPQPPTE